MENKYQRVFPLQWHAQGDAPSGGQPDKRAQWKADCILRRYDNFALMRLNALISESCDAAGECRRGSRVRGGAGRRGERAAGSPYFVQMQMFSCLRRIVHFNMARWVAKLTRKFRCMQISRLQQRGKWVERGEEDGDEEGRQSWRKSVLSRNKRSLQSCC